MVPSRPFVDGARGVIALVPAVVAFGAAFGAAAAAQAMPLASAVASSASIFTGAAQFAALELDDDPDLLLPLILTVVAVNARHLVLGAALHARVADVSAARRYAAMLLLSDANWASTMASGLRGGAALAHLCGGGIILWTAWVAGTAIGVVGAGKLALERAGVDALLPAFFVCVLVGGVERGKPMAPLWLAGITAAGASALVAPHWAMIIGTAAGIASIARRRG